MRGGEVRGGGERRRRERGGGGGGGKRGKEKRSRWNGKCDHVYGVSSN